MTFRTFSVSSKPLSLCVMLITGLATLQASSLTLTNAGKKDGFVLSTFATVNPGNANTFNYGTFRVAVASNGNVIVSNYPNDTRYVFSDRDGQTVSSALNTITPSGSSASAYATAGGQAYGGVNGQFVQFNSDGTINHILTGVTTSPYLGMAGDPSNGHIIASSNSGLIDIDPAGNGGTGSFRVINGSAFGDGVSVSPDGKTAYFEQGSINGYNIASGALVYQSGSLFNSPDGTGVISSKNSLNGQIIVNTNAGEIDLLNPADNTFVAIATGGTRGDYTSPDPNGTLFLDYSDTIERLACGTNCSIGPPPPTSPEPATFGLLGLPLLAMGLKAIKRRS